MGRRRLGLDTPTTTDEIGEMTRSLYEVLEQLQRAVHPLRSSSEAAR